jgi:hypothetical protein
MSREVTEAHYLHERHGLEAVLRPPVAYPTALKWVPNREQLIVSTRDGQLTSVDPILGTRIVAQDVGEAAALDVHPDRKRYLVVARGGTWQVGELGGGVIAKGRHSFFGNIDAFFLDEYVVMLGDGAEKRTLLVIQGTEVRARVRLPPRVIAVARERALFLCRSTEAGLEVVKFGKDAQFSRIDSTAHRLVRTHERIMGLTATGLAVWTLEGGVPRSMRMPELTAGDISADGRLLGLGTRHGAVALAHLDSIDKRVHPDLVKAFSHPVTSVSFSTRGRWLATGGDRLQIWTWEE